jgi:hypothetical protein
LYFNAKDNSFYGTGLKYLQKQIEKYSNKSKKVLSKQWISQFETKEIAQYQRRKETKKKNKTNQSLPTKTNSIHLGI